MISRRVRALGELLPGEGELGYFCITGANDSVLRAVGEAKMRGNMALSEQIKAIFNRYLTKYFVDFELTVPRGRGSDSFMIRTWRGDARFVTCFDFDTPLDVAHDWRSRLGKYPTISVTVDVKDRWIVLLDDVMTTGSTMAGHLLALLRAGANATALVLTRR